MDLMKLAGTLLSSDSLGGLSEATGSSDNDVSKVLVKALPALLSGANEQAKGKKTASSFASALSDHAKDDTSNLGSFLGNVDMDDGAKILTHLLGSGEEDTVEEIAEESGLDTSDVLKILSAAAPLLLSLLGQQTEEDKKEAVGDLVGVLLENVDVGSILTNLLTSNGSGKETKKAASTKKSSNGSTKKTTAKKSSSGSTKKTAAKKSTSSSTKKTTAKKSSSGSTKKTTAKKAAPKKKAASDNSTGDLVSGLLKNLLK